MGGDRVGDVRGAGLDASLAQYPEYLDTAALDRLRAEEYAHVAAGGLAYLDYTGSGVAARSQFRAHWERLRATCFGNPHSENPASRAATELVEDARRAVLDYFNAAPDEYVAVFTPNATGACRLVGEAYPFSPERRFVLTFDNHNSVNGIREFARTAGASTEYVPVSPPELRVDGDALAAALGESRHANGRPLARIYGPAGTNARGGTIALNFLDPDGAVVDERLVAKESAEQGFSLRTGCFCNPGAGERAFGITKALPRGQAGERARTIQGYLDLLELPTGGAIRVSFGVASSFADAERFLRFAEATYRDRGAADTTGLEPRLRC